MGHVVRAKLSDINVKFQAILGLVFVFTYRS